MATIAIALGGNAILPVGEEGTAANQVENIRRTCTQIAEIVAAGHEIVLTHGNGPQVGNLLIQQEMAQSVVPPMPMDVCGAMSQGMIGYWLQNQMDQALRARGIHRPVVTIVTQVLVDPEDPSFDNPSKPVGPFYTQEEAQRHMDELGWTMKEDAGRGWRRLVPSPEPQAIWEKDTVMTLARSGAVVICAGGGGVPVCRQGSGLTGCEAVIDKDLASQLLAREIGADLMCILTDVPRVALNYNQPEETWLDRVSAAELRAYLAEGHFNPGSMAPKVKSVVRFVEATGKPGVIASLEQALAAVEGRSGTWVIP